MQKYNISKMVDRCFLFVLLFIVFFIWIRYYWQSLWLSVLVAFAISFFICRLVNAFLYGKELDKKIKQQLNRDIDNYFFTLSCLSLQENLQFFKKVLKSCDAKISNNFVIVKNTAIYLFFGSVLQAEDVARIVLKMKECKKIIICCKESKIKQFSINNVCVEIFEKEAVYVNFFVKYGVFPDILIQNAQPLKTPFKQLLKGLFDRKKAKVFFYLGLLTLFSSLFVWYKLYYLIVSTIMFVLAVTCLLFGNNGKLVVKENIWE